MDSVLIQKVLTHLAYPTGFISLLLVLAFLGRIVKRTGFTKKCLWLALPVFVLSTNSQIAASLARGLENQYAQFSIEATPKADVIVVLGGSLAPPAIPRKFSQFTDQSNRFWLAGELFKAGKAKRIVLTGGNVFKQNYLDPESVYIREKLLAMGIPKEAIIVEPNSRTTRENAVETNKILQRINAKSALLVTSGLHMPRSIQLFSTLNINIIPVPSDITVTDIDQPTLLRFIPNSHALNLTTRSLHEYYGIAVETLQRFLNTL